MIAEVETKSDRQPPSNGSVVATGFWDDEIKEIGDKIVSLDVCQAKELFEYLESQGVKL